ncbi:aquaporin-9 [Tetranychus urticae]|uniref:Aquaporin n=1 Tax=Tetranychus urticae TaxID=32264 RepID=T1JRL7_TETUR|nr:aquaporin-9 [Tetranychus urticae]
MVNLKITSPVLREFLAELLGTFVLTTIGCSVNAATTVSKSGAVAGAIGPWGWGLALTAAIYVCGGVSGGHVNPAVTLGMATIGKLSWIKVPYYFAAQYIGAFFGALVTYLVYHESIKAHFGDQLQTLGVNGTAAIFGTLPNPNVSIGTCFLDQVVCVGFFLLLIQAITDDRNMDCPKGLIPIAIGVADLTLMAFAFGYNCGAPVNPARDLGPRLLSSIVGYGGEVFSVRNYNYFWVPIVATHIGGIIGSWIYVLFISLHWPVQSYDIENELQTNPSRK